MPIDPAGQQYTPYHAGWKNNYRVDQHGYLYTTPPQSPQISNTSSLATYTPYQMQQNSIQPLQSDSYNTSNISPGTYSAASQNTGNVTQNAYGYIGNVPNYSVEASTSYFTPEETASEPREGFNQTDLQSQNVLLYRTMCKDEAKATFETSQLQPPKKRGMGPGSMPMRTKYLSDSLERIINFQRKHRSDCILEFSLDKHGYDLMMSTAVNQEGSHNVNAVKFNFEGIRGGESSGLRNIGIPPEKMEEFNSLIRRLRSVT